MPRRSRKVVDSAPTWAAFRGWSVLLEHAPRGIGLAPGSAIADLTGAYCEHRRSPTEFAALPLESMHITLCDGINEGVQGDDEAVRRFTDPAAVFEPARADIDRLLTVARTRLVWRAVALEIRGHAVVAAIDTDGPLDEMVRHRDRLLSTLGAIVGADLHTPWRPHVTIGYLLHDGNLDDDLADIARAWEAGRPTFPPDRSWLTTTRAAIYTFGDMATFERAVGAAR